MPPVLLLPAPTTFHTPVKISLTCTNEEVGYNLHPIPAALLERDRDTGIAFRDSSKFSGMPPLALPGSGRCGLHADVPVEGQVRTALPRLPTVPARGPGDLERSADLQHSHLVAAPTFGLCPRRVGVRA